MVGIASALLMLALFDDKVLGLSVVFIGFAATVTIAPVNRETSAAYDG